MTSLYHLVLSIDERDEASRFYDAVLEKLGHERGRASGRLCTWLGDDSEILLCIA